MAKAKKQTSDRNRQLYNEGIAKYADSIKEASETYNVPVGVIRAMIHQESRWDPNAGKKTGKEDRGLMQIRRGAAKDVGADYDSLYDPHLNIMAGTEYLSQQIDRFGGDVDLGMSAYNAGRGNILKTMKPTSYATTIRSWMNTFMPPPAPLPPVTSELQGEPDIMKGLSQLIQKGM